MVLSRKSRLLILTAAVLAMGLVAFGCSKDPLSTAPRGDATTPGAFVLKRGTPAVEAAIRVQERYTADLMRIPGVVGTAVGAGADGRAVIKVYTETALGMGRLPSLLEGLAVEQEVTGRFVAFKGGGGGVSHTAKQTAPIQLGTSGGPSLDAANGYCCGGTLGSLVQKGGSLYILSNSHVLAGDVAAGGNGRVSSVGDDVIQPGLIDVNCNAGGAQVVADVSTLSTLYPPASTPNVDCAIAQIRTGMVRTDGAILEIGTLSATTVSAFVGQAVKKSGRTTGLTRGTISGLNATINVGYSTECGGTSFTKTFTGQIVVGNKGSRFLDSGDSGSLMVEDVTTNPHAVGLLYAGSSTSAIANPINDVLNYLGATMVGQ